MLQVQTEFAGGFDKYIIAFWVTSYMHVVVKQHFKVSVDHHCSILMYVLLEWGGQAWEMQSRCCFFWLVPMHQYKTAYEWVPFQLMQNFGHTFYGNGLGLHHTCFTWSLWHIWFVPFFPSYFPYESLWYSSEATARNLMGSGDNST